MKTAANLLLSFAGLAIGLLLGEILIRVLFPQQLVRPCAINDPELAFRGVPDCVYYDDWTPEYFEYSVRLNNYGLRMDSDLSASDSNHIFCLGDSFTYGLGVNFEATFFHLLQQKATAEGVDYQLVNAGFPGYSTGHCTKMLMELAPLLPGKKAIYFMYFNDLFDNINTDINYRAFSFHEGQGEAIELKPKKVYSTSKRRWHRLGMADYLYKHSHSFLFVKNALSGGQSAYQSLDAREQMRLTEETIGLMERVSLKHIEYLYDECQKRQLELQVVWIPCWNELELENDYGWSNNFPYREFKEQLKKQMESKVGFRFFDPTETINGLLRESPEALSKYYFAEGHYTEEGNALFFQGIDSAMLNFIAAEPQLR